MSTYADENESERRTPGQRLTGERDLSEGVVSAEGPPGELTDLRRTIATRPETSTSQTSESPGSSPSTVATDCGTVVFNDSELGAARKTFDSKERGIVYLGRANNTSGHKTGLSRGLRLDLCLKYYREHGPIDRPMKGTNGPWDETTEIRAIRMVSAAKEAVKARGRLRFEVRSAEGSRKYEVAHDDSGWSCDCDFWIDRRTPCKHVVAIVRWLDPNPPPVLDAPGPMRPTYSQESWPLYDSAQQLEHQHFDRYLWDLLGSVSERVCETGHRGRPVVPLRTQIMMSVRKVHLQQSSRRARGLMVALNQDGKGILPRVPNYSVPSRFFNRPQAPRLLTGLIEQSGLVLQEIEDRGTVSIDSSGFCTTCRGAYCTETHEPDRRHLWVKAHLMIGVKTDIVLACSVTDEHGGDSPQFVPLLNRVKELGHSPARVVADKAYLSRQNLDEAGRLGIDPFIPYKANSTGRSRGALSPMWSRKYHEFMSKRDEFDQAYHKRSHSESTFSAIKRKLGEPLLSHNQFARMNELLAKILAYNVGIVIQQTHFHGLDSAPVAAVRPPIPPADGAAAVAA
jgi:transposase